MQDVFEPKLNFGGEVFEPMNFDGDYSNFGLDPVSAGLNIGASAMDLTGKIVDARARKKEAEAKSNAEKERLKKQAEEDAKKKLKGIFGN